MKPAVEWTNSYIQHTPLFAGIFLFFSLFRFSFYCIFFLSEMATILLLAVRYPNKFCNKHTYIITVNTNMRWIYLKYIQWRAEANACPRYWTSLFLKTKPYKQRTKFYFIFITLFVTDSSNEAIIKEKKSMSLKEKTINSILNELHILSQSHFSYQQKSCRFIVMFGFILFFISVLVNRNMTSKPQVRCRKKLLTHSNTRLISFEMFIYCYLS